MTEEYRINLHAHSIFSDGVSSPLAMALVAKELDFTALVLTEHYYGLTKSDISLTPTIMPFYKKACKEARKILPVITGLEVPVAGQEVLVFGGHAIKRIMQEKRTDLPFLKKLKAESNCEFILCHPKECPNELIELISGHEVYNNGIKMPWDKALSHKPDWCNSDAHSAEGLRVGFNVIDRKITKEADLLNYIRKQVQSEAMLWIPEEEPEEMGECSQCGECCFRWGGGTLSATNEDIMNWEENAPHILPYVDLQLGDLWFSPKTGEELWRCPWLQKKRNKDYYYCQIEEFKPAVCRNYNPNNCVGKEEVK